MNLCNKFRQNRTMGKYSKPGGIGDGLTETDVENPRYNLKTPSLRLRNFFFLR